MEYQVKVEDIEECFKFAIKYYLDKTVTSNRTTGQYRGLGGIIDSFVIGKLIEIGVKNILEQYCQKEMVLDFDIHSITKDNISDPDVVKIKENSTTRDPKLFIEIKNISSGDRWIGLTAEQFSTIMKNKVIKNDPKKVFLIYATLISKTGCLDSDPLGVFLKSKTEFEDVEKFCDAGELYVKIMYIISGENLKVYGTEFNQGSYLYETEIIKEAGKNTIKDIKSGRKNNLFVEVKLSSNILPIIARDKNPLSKEIGEFKYNGNIKVFHKKNEKSKRMYLQAFSDTKIVNKILGEFHLEKGKIYESFYGTVGMNPTLKRNNIWIAQRNLKNVIPLNIEDSIKDIAKEI